MIKFYILHTEVATRTLKEKPLKLAKKFFFNFAHFRKLNKR